MPTTQPTLNVLVMRRWPVTPSSSVLSTSALSVAGTVIPAGKASVPAGEAELVRAQHVPVIFPCSCGGAGDLHNHG